MERRASGTGEDAGSAPLTGSDPAPWLPFPASCVAEESQGAKPGHCRAPPRPPPRLPVSRLLCAPPAEAGSAAAGVLGFTFSSGQSPSPLSTSNRKGLKYPKHSRVLSIARVGHLSNCDIARRWPSQRLGVHLFGVASATVKASAVSRAIWRGARKIQNTEQQTEPAQSDQRLGQLQEKPSREASALSGS